MNYVKEVEKIEQKLHIEKGKLEFHLKKMESNKTFAFVNSLYPKAHRVRGDEN